MNPDWENKRKLVIERDGYVCVDCGQKTDLNVHHLTLVRKKS